MNFNLSSIKVSIMRPDILGNYPCVVEPDEKRSGNYLIYLVSDKKVLFGQFFYKYATMNDYIYTIVIGNKLYQIKSSDLRNSRLVFMDKCQCDNSSNKNSSKITSPSTTLFQVTDSFSRLNDTYHVNIYDKEWPLGYFAITILFHLHEAQINRYEN